MQKIIHMLWLQGIENAPLLARLSVESWRRHNPGWDLRLYRQSDLVNIFTPTELGLTEKMTPQALSDFIRLKLLSKFGGVWADASTACMMTLDHWLPDVMRGGFFAFDRPGPDRPISSWFLASEADHIIIREWFLAAHDVWRQKQTLRSSQPAQSQAFIEQAMKTGPVWQTAKFWRGREELPYFWVHYLFDLLQHQSPNFKTAWQACSKVNAQGPQALNRLGLVNTPVAAEPLLSHLMNTETPLYKLNLRNNDPVRDPVIKVIFDQ